MKLYFIRHGKTDWNEKGLLQGISDIPLNENGIKDASLAKEFLKEIPFDFCVSSPLKRALKTAEIIIDDRNIPIIIDERIKEISFGDLEQKCVIGDEVSPYIKKRFNIFHKNAYAYEGLNGGEGISDVVKRGTAFLNDLISNENNIGKTILVSTHGCLLRAILNSVYKNNNDFWQGQIPPNCSITKVIVEDREPKIIYSDFIDYRFNEGNR